MAVRLTKASAGNGGRIVKILWVKPGKLLPLDSGGQLRTYNILRCLAAEHELTYLSYYGGLRDQAYEREIPQHIPGVVTVHTGAPDTTSLERHLDYLRRFPQWAPYSVSKFTDRRVRDIISGWFEERRFDVAVCDFLMSVLNFPAKLTLPTAIFQHNVETVLWKRMAEFEVKWVDRMISKVEYAKMARFEPRQVRRFHHVIAVSEADRSVMSSMVPASEISVVPTGVDLQKFQYDPSLRPAGQDVVFTGSMDWEANIDGVEFFCQKVWPLVLARVPAARFLIVGRRPHQRVKDLASATVEVTGTVPAVEQYLRRASVFVVPLRIGGGTRIKIYEGMAVGKATVSTTIGAEGLDVTHGKDIVLADDPHAFADAVALLLQDEGTRRRYEVAAAATAQKYDWRVITRQFVEVLKLTRQRAGQPSENNAAPAAAATTAEPQDHSRP
jgi:glycosyltransferase involved in cell wall biosynthesis